MRKADNLPPSCAVVTKSGNHKLLEPSWHLRACSGTDFAFTGCNVYIEVENDSKLKWNILLWCTFMQYLGSSVSAGDWVFGFTCGLECLSKWFHKYGLALHRSVHLSDNQQHSVSRRFAIFWSQCRNFPFSLKIKFKRCSLSHSFNKYNSTRRSMFRIKLILAEYEELWRNVASLCHCKHKLHNFACHCHCKHYTILLVRATKHKIHNFASPCH